jgi:hypothetical protein
LGKTRIARQIITEVERRRPRGFDYYPEYAGQRYPLPNQNDPAFPSEMTKMLPMKWIEHQFVGITIILSKGESAMSYGGAPPMCICVLTRDNDCFDALVENEYKPQITSNATYVLEPVLLGATINAYDIIPKLIDVGAPFDMADRTNILTSTTPYLIACLRGNIEWIEHMLRMGYDIDENHGNRGGDTCLHGAAMKGHYSLVNFLIEKGADITLINSSDGQSAYSLAVQHHHRHIQALLGDAFLKQRLPLPQPPSFRQRMQDMERQDEINSYIMAYMERTGLTAEDIMDNYDSIPYDPHYDFDGTYDPNMLLGNQDRTITTDAISGASQFLVQLDGVMYTAGTNTYKAKMKEYLDKYEGDRLATMSKASKEHDELIAMVEESLKMQNDNLVKEYEMKMRMPQAHGVNAQAGLEEPAGIQTKDFLSSKLYNEFQKQIIDDKNDLNKNNHKNDTKNAQNKKRDEL